MFSVIGGVLGPITNYYGTVENQGRGSLHLHMLLWLDSSPSPSQLRADIKDEKYRARLIEYLEDIIKEDVSWINRSAVDSLESDDGIAISVVFHVCMASYIDTNAKSDNASCLLTPDPNNVNFEKVFHRDVYQLVMHNNVHKHTATCYKYSKTKDRKKKCRMNMPRRTQQMSSIDPESGVIMMSEKISTLMYITRMLCN